MAGFKSGLIEGSIRGMLEHPEEYIESKTYFSWERYFYRGAGVEHAGQLSEIF